ncbi:MAG: hypothetical protein HOV80_35340 [Polyangiaceae bacterium]|nr:hypothetical protein [Polyangiaceae bacterium]
MRFVTTLLVVHAAAFVACAAGHEVARTEEAPPHESASPVASAPAPTPVATAQAPTPSASASALREEKPAECSQALLSSILEPSRIVSAKPTADENGRIVTVACTRGEADQACRKRGEAEALRDAPKGTKVVSTIVGEGAETGTIELLVEVDGSEQKWVVKDMSMADKRLQSLASGGSRVTVKKAERPRGRRATIMLTEPKGAPRAHGATLVVRSSDSVDGEIVDAARAKRVQVRAARRVDEKTWEVEVECKVEAPGAAAP